MSNIVYLDMPVVEYLKGIIQEIEEGTLKPRGGILALDTVDEGAQLFILGAVDPVRVMGTLEISKAAIYKQMMEDE